MRTVLLSLPCFDVREWTRPFPTSRTFGAALCMEEPSPTCLDSNEAVITQKHVNTFSTADSDVDVQQLFSTSLHGVCGEWDGHLQRVLHG